jgi:hypothetical protein
VKKKTVQKNPKTENCFPRMDPRVDATNLSWKISVSPRPTAFFDLNKRLPADHMISVPCLFIWCYLQMPSASTTVAFKKARAHIYPTDASIPDPRFSLLVFLVNFFLF